MQVIDANGNVFGGGIEITGPNGKPKTTGGGGGSPTGPAGGDLSGTYPNPGVTWANGIPTYNLNYYPLSLNPAGYIDSSALGPYLTAAVAAATYQPTLVSSANIKTINGSSILGSGDLTVSASGAPQIIAKKTMISHTGTPISGNSLIASENISAYISANAYYNMSVMVRKTAGGSSSSSFRLYVNTSATLTGATLIGTMGPVTSVNFTANSRYNFCTDASNNMYVVGASSPLNNNYVAATTSVISIPSPCFLLWASQTPNGDTIVLLNSTLTKYA